MLERRSFAVGSSIVIAGILSLFDCGCASDASGSSSDVSSCGAHTRPTTTNNNNANANANSNADVSFQRDVIPIFQASCAFSSCHSSANLNGIYLGVKGRTSDTAAIRSALLDQKSKGVAAMPYVTPKNPSESFLLRKLDGDFCNLECTNGKCGERMPKGGDSLPPEKLQTIETWIQNGAPDN